MNIVRTAKFWGTKWKIKFCNLDEDTLGDCDWDSKTIRTRDHHLKDELLLDTLIHEALHACCPWMAEYAIQMMATEIARYLWRLGYRLPEVEDAVEE